MSVLVSEVPALRDYFYPVAYGADLTVEPRRVELFGQGYAIWRPSPGWPAEAAADECPHRGARLSQGWLADGCVVCPYHGWRFEAGGACTLIPQNDPSLPIPPRARLLTAHCEERYGLVWLCIGTPRAGVPDFPHAGDAGLLHALPELQRHHHREGVVQPDEVVPAPRVKAPVGSRVSASCRSQAGCSVAGRVVGG